MLLRRILRLVTLLALVGVLLVPALPAAALVRKPPLPKWSLVGVYDLAVDPGFVSLQGSYSFDLEGLAGSVNVIYDANTTLIGNGSVEMTFFNVHMTSSVKDDRLQHVRIVDNPKSPSFTFNGVVTENGRDIEGTYHRAGGFGGLPGMADGALTLRRTQPDVVPENFRLRLSTTMNRRGVVRGAIGAGKREIRAGLDVYPQRTFDGGIVRGTVTTPRHGPTTARLNVKGTNWSIVMSGRVDVDGFHARAVIRAGGFLATRVPILLVVKPGPEPPPPPPPPDRDAYHRVTGANAQNVGGAVRITKARLASKFFGAPANVTIDFPSASIGAPIIADPSSSSDAEPVRFFVKVGTRTYGTAAAGAKVTLTVRQFSGVPGGLIEVLCKGRVSDGAGHTKTVDLLIDSILGP